MEFIDKNAFVYSMTSFGSGLMHSLFRFYYVKLFLDVYNISQHWFDIAQITYLIWNAVNDPLFAYWQDNSNIKAFRSRRHSILYGAPLFALSFLMFWFPWRQYISHDWMIGFHLLISLSCYDALYTFVLLASCALFAEISPKLEYRITLTRYCQVAGILGSFSVTGAEFIAGGLDDLQAFQMYCIFIAVLAWMSMHFTGKHVRTQTINKQDTSIESGLQKHHHAESTFTHSFQQFKDICYNRNFVAFVVTNFLTIFHMEYGANFLSIFGDQLLTDGSISASTRKALYGSSFFLPKILVLLLSPLANKYGYFCLIMSSFVLNLIVAIVMYIIGPTYVWCLFGFFAIDRTLSEFTFLLFSLPLSDIVDQDMEVHQRRSPLSSSVFGYNALFTKPAISLAPVMVVAILNRFDYQLLQTGELAPQGRSDLRWMMFQVSCLLPIVVCILRIIVWNYYTIRNTHSQVAKHLES